MSERVLLVTGASSGIGAALVRREAKPGVGLVIHARHSADALEGVADEARRAGARVETVLGDLVESDTTDALVAKTQQAFGRLDALVANAGFPLLKSFEEGTDADIEYAFKGNLFSFFRLTRGLRPLLKTTGNGRVIALGSYTAHVFRTDMPLFPMSAASKGALETAVRSLAIEFAAENTTVNCVVPGHINKDAGTRDGVSEERINQFRHLIPLGRLGQPDEVAALIQFLISRDASYISGQIMHVNGAMI